MADNVTTGTTGLTVLADEVTDGTLGTGKAQFVKVMTGTLDGTNKWVVDTHGSGQITQVDPSGAAVTFNANGQATSANSAPVTQASDTSFAYSASATFASTAGGTYTSTSTIYGGAKQFSLSAPTGKRIMFTTATMEIDSATLDSTGTTNGPWTLSLYNVTPPSSLADKGTFDLPSGDRASWLGQISLGTPSDLGSTQWIETSGINKQVTLSGTSVFGYLTMTTSSTAFSTSDHIVTLHAISV